MAGLEFDLREGVDRETIETVAAMGSYKYGWATDIEMDYAPMTSQIFSQTGAWVMK